MIAFPHHEQNIPLFCVRSGGADATPSKIQRTDRYGFIIPEGYARPASNAALTSREPNGGRDAVTPASEASLLRGDSAGDDAARAASEKSGGASGGDAPPERLHEGPPPSSPFGGVIPRHTLPATATSDRERKQQRAHLLLENLRIKKWMDMFAKWDEYVTSVCVD